MARPQVAPLALALALGAPVFAVCFAGCEEKKTVSEAPNPDASAGTDKYATADPKLARALQAASASAAGGNGPPPDGIFASGIADKRHPKGQPTKVDVVADGSEPRVTLSPASPEAGRSSSYGPAVLRFGLVEGRSAKPTIDLAFTLGPSKKDDGGPDLLVAEVKKASPAEASAQLGALPPGMDKVIGSLQGTELRFKFSASEGLGTDAQTVLGKMTNPDLDGISRRAAEALALVAVPLPSRPVGVGAQWIAESRMLLSGADAIAYRAFHVKSITGERLHLTVDVKAYLADRDAEFSSLPKGAKIQQYDAQAQGEMELVRGELLARMSDMQAVMVIVFEPPGADQAATQQDRPPGAMMALQSKSQATFARGDDLRSAARR
jgi:hypothetical protein